MLKCTLIAAVARVFEPGCKFDNCFVIVGKQGARKSTFWSTLGGHFFSDALKDISNKDSLMVLHQKLDNGIFGIGFFDNSKTSRGS